MKTILLSLGLILMSTVGLAQTPTLNFTLDTTTGADKKSAIPKLTWSTTPAATSCTAGGGSTEWAGAKPSSGTQTLSAQSATVGFAITCSWSGVTKAALTWVAPTTNTDGSPLTNLAGFRVVWGTNPTALNQTATLQGAAVRTWTSPNLAPGNWSFGVIAFNALGLESALSNLGSKTTTAADDETRTLELTIKIPSPPTNLTVE